jgi:hypothetical protein
MHAQGEGQGETVSGCLGHVGHGFKGALGAGEKGQPP